MNNPFTIRNAAKFALKVIVSTKVKETSKDIISNQLDRDEDDNIVSIPAHMIGWYVSEKLEPITDGMVDKTADWLAARKAAKQDNTK